MKPIPGYEGNYSITTAGRVFSHKRQDGGCGGKGGYLKGTPDPDGYLKVNLSKDGVRKTVSINQLMAQVFFGCDFVDHKDRNPSNNKLSNLRPSTLSQNRINAKRNSNNTSGFRGVTWRKDRNRWLARIKVGNSRIILGNFEELENAARAYDEGALKYFGEFAVLNFPRGQKH